ncbi:MAG: aminodeoxychorismate/anthranilate synthase component II [Alphaproteobacteria bacterium]|nr:aminodeoxychorismate/anthranilate synthase component II [Alphaproteobacteria bacterium]
MHVLLIDNYDSFTHNLARYVRELGSFVTVKRCDEVDENIDIINPTHLIISPGPGHPQDAKISLQMIKKYTNIIPILGVCLGHQCMAYIYGASIIQSIKPQHGKTSIITHTQTGLFKNVPNNILVTRYHSLVIDPNTLPACFTITAETEDKEIMAIAHNKDSLVGVQFHPEALLTEYGYQILNNFLKN